MKESTDMPENIKEVGGSEQAKLRNEAYKAGSGAIKESGNIIAAIRLNCVSVTGEGILLRNQHVICPPYTTIW